MTQNIVDQDYQNNSDGFLLGGGTTERKLTISGADITVVGSGSATQTLPTTSQTLASLGADESFTGVKTFNPGFLSNLNSYVTTQFDKTTDTTLAAITGLTATVVAGKVYHFRATLHVSPSTVGGSKYAIAGTATATSIRYEILLVDNTTNANTVTSTQNALGGSSGQAGTTTGICIIEGTIVVNVGGTLLPQFSQNVSSGTSSVLINSTFLVTRLT